MDSDFLVGYGGLGIIFSLGLVVLLLFVFWIIMFIDSITRKFKKSAEKVLWIIVNFFFSFIGSLIYYFSIFRKDENKSIKWFWRIMSIMGIIIFILLIIFVIGLTEIFN